MQFDKAASFPGIESMGFGEWAFVIITVFALIGIFSNSKK